MASMTGDPSDGERKRENGSVRALSPSRWAALAILAALVMVVGALLLQRNGQPAGAVQAAGSIDFIRLDADPNTAGIQTCFDGADHTGVPADTNVSFDILVDTINPADADDFAALGNAGINFTTGEFVAPFTITYNPGPLGTDPTLSANTIFAPTGNTTAKTAGLTHVAKGYANPVVSPGDAAAAGFVGPNPVLLARVTLKTGTGTGVRTINVSETTPLDASYDTFLGNSPNVQPAGTQGITIAIGATNCQAGTPSPTPTPGPTLKGDIDCDDSVTSVDALFILRNVAHLSVTLPEGCPPIDAAAAGVSISAATTRGDIDCDGVITAVDALFVLRYVAQLSVTLPTGCPPIGGT